MNENTKHLSQPRHGHCRAGHMSLTYRAWNNASQRIMNPKASGYERYGGRGLGFCPRWRASFIVFLAENGERPEGKTIDRIDNDLGYLCGRPECCGQESGEREYALGD